MAGFYFLRVRIDFNRLMYASRGGEKALQAIFKVRKAL
jgi:hypothetical protein